MNERIKPRRLYPGDTVGITAPASWGDREQVKAAAACLVKLGLQVRLGESLSKQHGYLAGTDEERARELNGLFADPEIKAIICARGGYGTGRIADMLDYGMIRANRKFSGDIATLPFFCMRRLESTRDWLLSTVR